MLRRVVSVGGVSVRLTDERWLHVVENHDELAGMLFDVLTVIIEPDFVAAGWKGELLAVRRMNGKYLVAVYREVDKDDGFVITAFVTRRIHQVRKRKIIWSRQS